jgi:hypothetical protein
MKNMRPTRFGAEHIGASADASDNFSVVQLQLLEPQEVDAESVEQAARLAAYLKPFISSQLPRDLNFRYP